MALRSANHTVIGVLNTLQCDMIHQLVWYAQFIFLQYIECLYNIASYLCNYIKCVCACVVNHRAVKNSSCSMLADKML